MSWRLFQVREFNGLYSVVYNKDLPNGTEVYENNQLIDLPYDEAVKQARQLEERFAKNEITIDTDDADTWTLVYSK